MRRRLWKHPEMLVQNSRRRVPCGALFLCSVRGCRGRCVCVSRCNSICISWRDADDADDVGCGGGGSFGGECCGAGDGVEGCCGCWGCESDDCGGKSSGGTSGGAGEAGFVYGGVDAAGDASGFRECVSN